MNYENVSKKNLKKIDYAVIETLRKYPSRNPEDLMLSIVFFENFPRYITSQNKARDVISSLTQDEIIKEIIRQALKVAVVDKNIEDFSDKQNCYQFLNYIVSTGKKKNIDILEIVKSNPKQLDNLARSFANIRYRYRNPSFIEFLDNYTHRYIKDYLASLEEKDTLRKMSIFNVRIFSESVNKCREDILRGVQIQKGNVEYSVGRALFAKSVIGKRRNTQEDSVLLLEHPRNKKFKMLLVADGVGGALNGEKASSYTAKELACWFEKLNYNDDKKQNELLEKLKEKIIEIKVKISKEKDGRGSTLVCAIVGDDKTLVVSVGDSRAYITKGNQIHQITRDDSYVQMLYEKGYIVTKDDMRFHKRSNYIVNSLGADPDNFYINSYFIDNDSYDKLLLLSDGVTDCLSDNQIMAITKNTPRDKIAAALVDAANTIDSHRERKNDSAYYDDILAGKDNTTAAVFTRRK